MKLVMVSAILLMDKDRKILLAQRPAGKSMAGMWEFPGGKIEEGESPELALIREVREELGIIVDPKCLAPLSFASHAYGDFHLLMPLFLCRKWEGFAQALEGQVLKWVDISELRNFEMPPADLPLIAMIEDYFRA